MPHGSGHAGGGHHGGGHHHHGGGFGHHHHHHHHHHGYVGYGYGGRPYYRYGYRRNSFGWGIFFLIIFAVAITCAVVFSLRYGLSDDNSNSNDFAPNETRAVSYSSSFCDSITVNTEFDVFPTTNAELYVLSQTPALTDHDSFSFSESELVFHNEYQHWYYYLYPGSTLLVSACKQSSASTLTYYLIKGQHNFNSWRDYPRSSVSIEHHVITSICSSGTKQQFPIYNVGSEGEYYMAFYLSSFGSDNFEVDFNVTRTKFAIDPDTVLSNCSVSNSFGYCTLEVPLSGSVGVLALSSSGDIDWSSSISVSVDCNARIWVFVLISLGCVVFVVLVTVGIVVGCCVCMRRKKNAYTPMSGNDAVVAQAPAPTTTTVVTGNEVPPPYNPGYGSTAPPPPKYF